MVAKTKLLSIFLLTSLYISCSNAEPENSGVTEYGFSSLEHAILNSIAVNDPPNDAGGLIVMLGNIDDDNARKLLVKFTSYYLGSATGEALTYSIVKQGDKIVEQLNSEIGTAIKCVPKNNITIDQCLTVEQRHQRIQRYLKYIESDEKIEYVL